MKITRQELDRLNKMDDYTNERTDFFNSIAKKYNFDPLTHAVDSETGEIIIFPPNQGY